MEDTAGSRCRDRRPGTARLGDIKLIAHNRFPHAYVVTSKSFAECRSMERRRIAGIYILIFLCVNWVCFLSHFVDGAECGGGTPEKRDIGAF